MKTIRFNFYVAIILLSIGILMQSCGGKNKSSANYEFAEEDFDGTYCADVEYYNPNTGTRSNYTLNIEASDNYLVSIYWPSGGWLDNDHFAPEAIGSDGSCEIQSDRGYYYSVRINGSPCSDIYEDPSFDEIEENYEEDNPGYSDEEEEDSYDDESYY